MKTTDKLIAEQVRIELEMKALGIKRFEANQRRMLERGTAHNASGYKQVIVEHLGVLTETFQAIKDYENGRSGFKSEMVDILNKIDAGRLAYIALASVSDLSVSKDSTLTKICSVLGGKVLDEINFGDLEEHAPKYFKVITDNLRKKGSVSYKHQRNALSAAARNSGFQMFEPSKTEVIRVGALILDQVRQIKDSEGYNIFSIDMVDEGGKTKVIITPSSTLSETLNIINDNLKIAKPCYAPCVIPPRGYVDFDDGGFHVDRIAHTNPLVKTKRKHQDFFKDGKADICLNAVNYLQNVGYKVSIDTLDILSTVIDCKLPLAIPEFEKPSIPKAPIPEGLEDLHGKELTDQMTAAEQKEFFNWKSEVEEIHAADKNRVQTLSKLGELVRTASKYRKYNDIYFVHNLDYRQRVNVRSNYLTTQGDDTQKGLIRFSEGAALGYKGAFWFLVQGAGVWNCKIDGVALDKMDFKSRARYMIQPEIVKMVKAIYHDPISCAEWVNADKPWQFLNWAFEYGQLIELVEEGGDYRTFVSHIPVAMDGSCSGTQHYSVALRDKATAKVVNLLPSDKPNDIYNNAIAVFGDMVRAEIEACKEGEEERKQDLEEWLNHLDRNLSKLPVMTLVYAATVLTTREAIIDYLRDIQLKADRKARAAGLDCKPAHNFKDVKRAVKVATPILWAAVQQTQAAAARGMAYLKKGAREISKRNKAIKIKAPTGFVMTQEIFSTKNYRIRTKLMGETQLMVKKKTDIIDVNKSVSSSTPNIIHLMDSSHLILAVNMCERMGIKSLLVIHDSFSCLAKDVSKMRRALKKSLVFMYENYCPFDEMRYACLEATEGEVDLGEIDKGDLDLKDILKARYAFS